MPWPSTDAVARASMNLTFIWREADVTREWPLTRKVASQSKWQLRAGCTLWGVLKL